ncbi:restriction endonuclease subunit S [Solibacillus sp. FSL R7-0668]|uniref:restriction endonuclease subunit S n=1 Tax=Solibacillus sp. FSL R7-0668 TaxID=2921688 RepID=UPI0030F7757E
MSFKELDVQWLGVVPEDWRILKLKYLCDINTGSKDTQDKLPEGEFPFFVRSPNVERLNEFTHDEEAVMTAGDGVGVGKVFHYYEGKFAAHQRVYVFTKFKNVMGKYLYYYLLSNLKFEVLMGGAKSTVDSLRRPMLSEFPVVFPNISTQEKLVKFLDQKVTQISYLIESKEKYITVLEQQRQSIITEAVTKGLNPNVKMKDSGVEWIGEIPEHWEKTRIDFVSRVKARLGWKGLKAEEYVDEGYAFLSTPNLKYRDIDFNNVNYITEERYLESPEIMLELGDVLLAKDGSTLGIVNVVRGLPIPTTVNSSIAVLRPTQKIDSVYFYYYLKSTYIQDTINQIKDGMGVPHLFQADIKKFKVLLPPLKEQQEIAKYLDDETLKIESLIVNVKSQIEKLKEYRQSLIYEAVTGKIDVRELELD